MADARYVIDLIINAKDNTAAAFAEAIGHAEAFKRITEEQKRANSELTRSYVDMTNEISTKSRALNDVIQKNIGGNVDAAKKVVELKNATEEYVRTVEKHGRSSAEAAVSAGKLLYAEEKLTDQLDESKKKEQDRTSLIIIESTKRIAQSQRELEQYKKAAKEKAEVDSEAARVRAEETKHGQEMADEIEEEGQIRHKNTVQRRIDDNKREAEKKVAQVKLGQEMSDEIEEEGLRKHKIRVESRIAINKRATDERVEQERIGAEKVAEIEELGLIRHRSTVEQIKRRNTEQERQLGLGQQYLQQIQQIANLEKQRQEAERRGAVVERVKLDIDVAEARKKAEVTAVELRRLLGHIEANVDLDDAEAVAHAAALRETLNVILKDLKINVDVDAGRAIAELVAVRETTDDVKNQMGLLRGTLQAMNEGFNDSSGRVASFDNFLRGLMSLGIATFFNQLILLAGAAAGALLALASSAATAGAAIGGALTAGIAQAIPAVGILAAAFSRVTAVLNAAKQAQLVQQQQSYQGEKQDKRSADAADQVKSAQDRLADAHRRVAAAQEKLNQSREDAANKLRDLIFQERGLSLTMGETQDAIDKATRQGGDVSTISRLQLQRDQTSAQLGDVRGDISARQAGPAPEIQQAKEGLRDAQRAAADAARGLEQAKRSATQADAGVTAGIGKLDFLLSRLSDAEKRLYRAVTRLQEVWRGFAQTATEPLINAFTDAVKRITVLLQDKTIINAAKGLADGLAEQFSRVFGEFTSGSGLAQMLRIVDQSKDSLKPLADIIINMGHAFLDVGEAAAPALKEILDWLVDITGAIADFFREGRKSGDLGKFFELGVTHLKAWGDLLWQVIRLFAAIAGPGGGAESGLKMVQDLGKTIRKWADDIREPGTKLNEFFQRFFDLSRKMIDAMAPVLKSIADEFNKTFTKDGLKSVEGFATFLADVLIPALGDFARTMGEITGKIGEFAKAHPQITKFASALLGATLVLGIMNKAFSAFGVVTKPIEFLIKRLGVMKALTEAIKFPGAKAAGGAAAAGGEAVADTFLAGGAAAGAEGVAAGGATAIAAPVALVTGAIVGLLAISGQLDDVWNKIKDTAKRTWKEIQPGIEGFKKTVGDLVDTIQQGGGLIDVLKFIGFILGTVLVSAIDALGDIFTGVFNGLAQYLGGIIKIITGVMLIFQGHVGQGFKKIGEGILDMFKGFATAILGIFKGIGGMFGDLGKLLVRTFGRYFNSAFDTVKRVFGDIVDFVSANWKYLVPGVAAIALWKKFGPDVLAALKSGWQTVRDWLLDLPHSLAHYASEGAKAFAGEIKKIPDYLAKGFSAAGDLIRNVVGSITTFINDHTPFGDDLDLGLFTIHLPKLPEHFQQGGPVPGSGRGDSIPALLEPGEHVWTSAEVAAAGGHQVMFALRRIFGGGTQATGSGMATGGFPVPRPLGQSGLQDVPLPKQAEEAEKDRKEFKRSNEQRAIDWATMWKDMLTTTRRYANDIAEQIRELRVDSTATLVRMRRDFGKILDDIVDSFDSHSTDITKSWAGTFDSLKKITYEGLNYIGHETNKALHALGIDIIHFGLTAPATSEADRAPRAGHATGGMVGLPGERGRDNVRTVLGRGEAVLNYAQQAYVEPALHAFYGHGLQDTFKRIRGFHAGGPGWGFASGGNTGPGHSGEGFTPVWNMAKNKFHMTGFTGADGHSKLSSSGNVSDHWYHRALDMSNGRLTAQEDALNAFFKTKVPQVVKQLIWRNVDQFRGFPIGGHEDHVHLAMLDQYAFDGPRMAKILSRAMRGLSISDLLAGGTGAEHVDPLRVDGPGPLKVLAQKLLNKARDAANSFIDAQAARFAGGTDTGPGHGEPYDGPLNATFNNPNTTVSFEQAVGLAKQAGFPDAVATLFGHIASAESTLRPGIVNSIGATGLWQIYDHPDLVAKYGDMRNPWHNAQAAYDLWKAGGTSPWVSSQDSWGQYAATGGYAGGPPEFAAGGQVPGGPGQPIPIVAHAGEWILNKAQQSKIAAMIGLGTDRLRDMLGFTGGPTHFQGGGAPRPFAPSWQVSGPQEPGPMDSSELDGILKAIAAAKKALAGIKKSKAKDKLEKFADEMSKLGAEDGLISEMGTAIEAMAAGLQRTFDLAKVGFKRVGSKLVRRSPLVDAVEIAQESVDMYADIYVALRAQREESEKGLAETNAKIKQIEGGKGGVTKKEQKVYEKLITDRANFHNRLNESDQAIAENRQKMFEAQVERFNAQTAAALKPDQKSQAANEKIEQIATVFGTAGSDTAMAAGENIKNSLVNQKATLEAKLAEAKGKSDPRWAAVAEGLEKDIAALDITIAERTHKNLETALNSVNDKFSKEQAGFEVKSRIAAITDPGALPGLAQKGLDSMNNQIAALQGVLDQAVAAGDTGEAEKIRAQIDGLKASVVEAGAKMLQDAIDAVNKAAAREETRLALLGRRADLRERAGDRLGAAGERRDLAGQRETALNTQLTGLSARRREAEGNVPAMEALDEQIADLRVTIDEQIQTTKDLTFTFRKVATEIISERTSRITGLIGTASDIIRHVGTLVGAINFPKLQALLVQTGATLRKAAEDIVKNVGDAIPDFGGEGGNILGQLRDAFQKGPEAFATVLAQLGPAIAALEEGMSPEQKDTFQKLIDSMIGNTTAVLDNTDQLNQLNNRNTAQGFTSSLWQVFREAVFTGSGRILPQFQFAFPQMQSGGYIHSTGLYNLHAGEMVVPAAQVNGNGGGGGFQQNLYITNPTEVADPDYIFAVAEFQRSQRRAT